jgi:hypothetical protein
MTPAAFEITADLMFGWGWLLNRLAIVNALCSPALRV